MSGGMFERVVTLFNRKSDGTYQASLLLDAVLASSEGVSGGDAAPVRRATLYFLDARSRCCDGVGVARKYVAPSEWAALGDTSGSFTFDRSGGDWFACGDKTALAEPPYAAAYRIVGVERRTGRRRLLCHYKINGA